PCLDIVVTTHVADDVVAVATVYDVVAEPPLEDVVAAIAVKRVITDAGNKHIIALGTSEYDVLVTRILEVVLIWPARSRVVSRYDLGQQSPSCRIGAFQLTVAIQIVELLGLVDLQDETGP